MPVRTASVVTLSDDFGAFLRVLRRRARITQRELGLRVGYSEGHVCRLEQNQRVPELSVLAALFVPALGLANDPAAANRLLDLAKRARGTEAPPIVDPATPRIPVPPAHLVARPDALAGLRDLLAAEHLVVVRGLPGTGKTTLAAQYARERHSHESVCWVTVTPGVTATPEALVRQLARHLAGQGRAGVAALVEPGHGQPLPLDRQVDRLVAALAQRPTLVCLDNAQALTGDGVLATLSHLTTMAGVRLLLTSRTSLDLPGAVTFRLGGLDREQGRDLVARLDPDMPPELGATLVERTAGNPMLLRLALGQARQPGTERAYLVASLATNAEIGDYLLSTTLDRLGPAATRLVGLLSVFRQPVDLHDDVLAEHTQAIDGPLDLLAAIGELRRRQLVDDPAAAALHPLVRDHTYARLVGDPARRRRLHRIAGVWSEQARDDVLEAAWQFRRAGEYEQAVEVLTDRVRTLIGRGQGLAAADLVIDLRDRVRRAGDDADLGWRPHVLLGDLLLSTTRWSEAESAYRAALAAGGPDALWATVASRLARSLLQRGQSGEALQLCLAATERLGADDTLLLAEVTTAQAQARVARGELDDAIRLGRQALELAERVGTIAPEPADAVAAIAGGTVGVALAMRRRFEPAIAHLRAAIDRAQRAGLTQIAARVRFNLVSLHLDRGELSEPPHLLDAVAAQMREIGDAYGLARVVHLRAYVGHFRGECAEALARYDEACVLKRQVGDAPGVTKSMAGRAAVLRSLGRIDEALAVLDGVSAGPDVDPRVWVTYLDVHGVTLLIAGRIDEALQRLRAALDAADTEVAPLVQLHLALARLAAGDPASAAALTEAELPGPDAPLETRLDARLVRAAVALARHDPAGVAEAADDLSIVVKQTGSALHRETPGRLMAVAENPPAPADIPRLLWVTG